MRPNLTASFSIHIPGIRATIPQEIKIVEGVVSLNGKVIDEAPAVEEAAPAEVAAPAEEVVPVEEAPAAEAPATEEAAAAPEVSWSLSMTKSELLDIASQLGLTDLSSSNTKAEILSALDATKQ